MRWNDQLDAVIRDAYRGGGDHRLAIAYLRAERPYMDFNARSVIARAEALGLRVPQKKAVIWDQPICQETKGQAFARLWAEGQSASFIAKELGISRNTVLGKIHRDGLHRTSKKVARQPIPKPKKFTPHWAVEDAWMRGSGEIRIGDIQEWMCRWPVGGEGCRTVFCGTRRMRGMYCADHAKAAYTKAPTPQAL